MVIIISGCDRTGKTTFCNTLKQALNSNINYIHFSAPKDKDNAYNEYKDYIEQINNNQIYIIDRFYECECIYAPIFRGYKNIRVRDFDNIIRKKTKVLFIYIKSDLDIIKQRINDIGDDYINLENINDIYYNYETYMESIQLPYIILNNNSFADLQNNINIVLNLINNYNFIDDYFGNLQANKAIIFPQEINNMHEYILNDINPTEKLHMKKNTDNIDELGNYLFSFQEKIRKLVTYTEYFYTNNDKNVDLLNINERLYIA